METKKDVQQILEELNQEAKYLLAEKVIFHERIIRIRNIAGAEGVYITDSEAKTIDQTAKRVLNGISAGESQEKIFHVPLENWLCEGLICQGRLNLLVSLQKVGKSSFVAGLLNQWKYDKSEFLGCKFDQKVPPTIIVGTDQYSSDWVNIFEPVGLMARDKQGCCQLLDPIKKLWHLENAIHLDEAGIELITNEAENLSIKYEQPPLIVVDSLNSVCQGLGIDEFKPESKEPIQALIESVSHVGATTLLLHHASKSRSHERASNASRGSNAIPALASQIILLDWLTENRTDHRVTLTTQGRNGKPLDLVIEQESRSRWISHGSSRDIQRKLQLDKLETKLNEKQSTALGLVRTRWENCPSQKTDSTDLAGAMPEEYGWDKDEKNAIGKARSTLDQLTKKGFLFCKTKYFDGRGNVNQYQPDI